MNREQARENLVAFLQGEIDSADRTEIERLLESDEELRNELESFRGILGRVHQETPSAPELDMDAFKARLMTRFEKNETVPAQSSRRESRRTRRLYVAGIRGLRYRWNWIPYAISTCAAALVLVVFNFIIFEHKLPGFNSGNDQAARRGKDWDPEALKRDGFFVITAFDTDTRTEPRLRARSIAVNVGEIRLEGLTDVACLVGVRDAISDAAHLRVYSKTSWETTKKYFGEEWIAKHPCTEVPVVGGSITIPDGLFTSCLSGNIASLKQVRVVEMGDLSRNGYVELWNPRVFDRVMGDVAFAPVLEDRPVAGLPKERSGRIEEV